MDAKIAEAHERRAMHDKQITRLTQAFRGGEDSLCSSLSVADSANASGDAVHSAIAQFRNLKSICQNFSSQLTQKDAELEDCQQKLGQSVS